MNAQVRLTSLLGPSPLPNINEFINTSKLPLSAAPYSIAPSTSANRLWSSICSFFLFFFYFFSKKKGHLWVIPWASFIKYLNTWHKQVGLVSRQGCRFILRAFFTLYTSYFLPYFSYFIIVDLQRERVCHFENFASVILLTSLPLLSFFCWGRHLSRNRLLTW